MADFLRFCELTIGPLAEHQGAGRVNEAVRIIADGTNSNLRVAFTSDKTITGEPNKTEIDIYNLSRETRQAIRSNLTRVRVVAGYSSAADSAAIVASGALLSVVSYKQGPDTITHLSILDGYGGMVYGFYSRGFAGGTPLAQVVKDVATSLPGVEVGRVDLEGTLAGKGVTLAGQPAAQLNKLADQHGFSWSVQNGVFQAVGDNADTGRDFSFDSDFNLLQCVPLLQGPLQFQVGVEVTGKFDARLTPGDRMTVRSTVSPQLSGTYKATTVNLQFDSHGPALLRAQSMRYFTL